MIIEALEALCDGLRDELNVATYPFVPVATAELPAICFLPVSVDYHVTAGPKGRTRYQVDAFVLLSRSDEESAQQEALSFVDEFPKAVDALRNVAGASTIIKVNALQNIDYGQIAGTNVLVLTFEMEIFL